MDENNFDKNDQEYKKPGEESDSPKGERRDPRPRPRRQNFRRKQPNNTQQPASQLKQAKTAEKTVEHREQEQRPPRPEQRSPRQAQRVRTVSRETRGSISVVVPLYNEEESLPELALQLEGELKKVVGTQWEVIFVDDGSSDNSFTVLRRIHDRNPKFKAIRFRRNYGKSSALAAGFAEAKGSTIITMDADLQDDPAEILNLVNKIHEGYDLVSGWKKKRKDPISKTIPSRFFNFVTSVITGIKLHDFNCGLKAYRREVVKSLNVYGEMHRYLPALAHWEGFRITEIPVKHHARRYGKTKFGLSRFVKGFLDLLTVIFTTRFFKRPLHFFGTIGSLAVLIGFATDAYLTVEWIMGKTALSNRPLALLGVALIIVGVQFISMGLLGELIAKNTHNQNNFSIKERL